VSDLLTWVSSLPPVALYTLLAVSAAIESIFPPLPSDTIVAFGSFLAARDAASVVGTFLSTWGGSVAGAMGMYVVGRHLGTAWLDTHVRRFGGPASERWLESAYARHGLWALAASRFVPGVRALVPPLAGALRIPWPGVLVVVAGASALWYGVITYFAFQLGESWDAVSDALGDISRTVALGAAAAIIAMGAWIYYRRRRSAE